MTTTYSKPVGTVSEEQLFKTFREFYSEQPFVRVVSSSGGQADVSDPTVAVPGQ